MTTIHTTPGCPATLRVVTALEHLGAPYQLELHPDGWFQAEYGRSGPMLEDGGLRLLEINAILRYVARCHPAGGLWPAEAGRAAETDAWMDFAIGQVRPALRQVGSGDPAGREALVAALGLLDRALADRSWLAGGTAPTVADLALLHMTQMAGLGMPVERLASFVAWTGRLAALPALARAIDRTARARVASSPLDALVAACRAARSVDEVVAIVTDAVARRDELLAAIGPCGEQATRTIYRSPTLTVQWLSWAPGMRAPAHDHRMWAVIGVLRGREDNGWWRRGPDGLERAGAQSIAVGEVARLADDVIHDVCNPLDEFTIALHVYGGDIIDGTRSSWHPMTGAEAPFNGALVEQLVAEFNARQRREPVPFTAASVPRILGEIMSALGPRP